MPFFVFISKTVALKIAVGYNIKVLNGELAVPCNLQSATAGLNTRRGIPYGKPTTLRGVDIKVLCNFYL